MLREITSIFPNILYKVYTLQYTSLLFHYFVLICHIIVKLVLIQEVFSMSLEMYQDYLSTDFKQCVSFTFTPQFAVKGFGGSWIPA